VGVLVEQVRSAERAVQLSTSLTRKSTKHLDGVVANLYLGYEDPKCIHTLPRNDRRKKWNHRWFHRKRLKP
jgi:hypothetical protein